MSKFVIYKKDLRPFGFIRPTRLVRKESMIMVLNPSNASSLECICPYCIQSDNGIHFDHS